MTHAQENREKEQLTNNCKTKCEIQKTLLAYYKEALISCSGKVEKAVELNQNLIMK
jgi:hypothetical protein